MNSKLSERFSKLKRSPMSLLPTSAPKSRPSWKLLPVLILVVFSLAFLLFRDSRSISSQPPQQENQVTFLPSVSPLHLHSLPPDILSALVHYATTEITPQQTREEFMLTARVLSHRGPCNLLVFGLGHDSLLWQTLNYKGRTVFLEESDDWIRQVTEKHPELEAHQVEYSTVLTDSDNLLEHARENRKGKCTPVQNLLLSECKLALYNLPNELFQLDWDVIMVDAPRGYFPEAPGRMSAIFSAAVMARNRKGGNGTDVFVHDVERPVERAFSEEFLCRENLVEESESTHLWHFKIFPSPPGKHEFCSSSVPSSSS